tara:strand:+ start:125 stop:352 length:228 start_codon:yes stop_codon:yes gene_type:complete
MRASEFMHYINRIDIGLGANPKERDYTHFTPRMLQKRARYEHQKKLRQETKEELQKKKDAEKAATEIRKYFKEKK